MELWNRIISMIFIFFTIVFSTIILIRMLWRVYKGNNYSQCYAYFIVYVFYLIPLIIEFGLLFIGEKIKYIIFWAANESMNDMMANLKYCVFISILCFFLDYTIKNDVKVVTRSNHLQIYNKTLGGVCAIIVVFPFIYLLSTAEGRWMIFSEFGIRYKKGIPINETILSITLPAYLLVLSTAKKKKIYIFFLTMVLFAYFWVIGKRYFIAEALILIIYTLALTNQINGRKAIRTLLMGTMVVFLFCVMYGIVIKGNFTSVIDYINVDFSRQYTLVYQFYCDSIGRKITFGKFDSFLFILFFWFPRNIWKGKPYPFVNSLTWSLVGQWKPMRENLGWAATCSIFNELYSSFDFAGLVLGIWLVCKICKMINKEKNVQVKIFLSYFLVCSLTIQSNAYIIQAVFIGIITVLFTIFGKKRMENGEQKVQ